MKKEQKQAPKKLGKATKPKKLGKAKVKMVNFGEKIIKESSEKIIARKGYTLYILPAEAENAIRELENTGRMIGEIRFDDGSSSIKNDEIIIAIRK